MAGYVILVTNLLKGILFSLNFAFCSWDFSGFFDVFFFRSPCFFVERSINHLVGVSPVFLEKHDS